MGVATVFTPAGAEPAEYIPEVVDCKLPKTMDVYKRFTSKL